MRKRFIGFLYKHRIIRVLLPLYHVIIGKTIVIRKKNNELNTTSANLYHDRIDFTSGRNNYIYIGDSTSLERSRITIKGNNNKIIIGENSFCNGLVLIVEGNDNCILIGRDAFILDDTRIYVVDGSTFKLGNGCMLSDRIEIRTTDNHSILDRTTSRRLNYEEDVIIQDNVWIGTGATILKGAEIAEGCIVGASSVITRKHTVPFSIIAGNPAKNIKSNVIWTMERIRKIDNAK